MSTSSAIGTPEAVDMLHTNASSAIVLPDGASTMENGANRHFVSTLKGVALNLVTLPREGLHLLQDGVIAKLRAHKHCTLQVISE